MLTISPRLKEGTMYQGIISEVTLSTVVTKAGDTSDLLVIEMKVQGNGTQHARIQGGIFIQDSILDICDQTGVELMDEVTVDTIVPMLKGKEVKFFILKKENYTNFYFKPLKAEAEEEEEV